MIADESASEHRQVPSNASQVALPYRFAPRPPGGFTVARKDLLGLLTEASLLKQLSLVRGPAGSGKTTLLSQWRAIGQEMERRLAWLTVDKADRDPFEFITGMADALDGADCRATADGFRAVSAETADRSPVQIARLLAAAANRANERPVIVLDRYEHMDGPVAGEIISGFLDHTTTTHLMIATRVRPAIPLSGLRARDQLFEIAPSDLNLTPMEIREVFHGDIPELYTRRLYLETSGEAVAVGFARRVMEEVPRTLGDRENWQNQLHEYYRAEVLDTLPLDLRDAISRLVIVERFDLSLASALLGRNATAMVERLHQIDGLLLSDRGSNEFYFSEMLRRFLEQRLAWIEDNERASLHSRAASWFATRGLHVEALRHAIAAGDSTHARQVFEKIGYANLVAHQGVRATHMMLDAAGLAGEATTGTLLSMALVHAHEGDIDKAASCLREAKRCLPEDGVADPAMQGELVLADAFVAGFLDETLQADTAPALNAFLSTAPENNRDGRAQAQILLSWDRYCHGDIEGAEQYIDRAAEDYAETESAYGSLFLHVHRTLACFWRNDLDRALVEITLAEQMTRIFFPDDQRLRAMTGMLRAGILFEMGRPDPLVDMIALVGTVGAIESWTEIQIWSHVHAARAAIAQGRANEARGIMAYGLEVAKRLDAPRLNWSMRVGQIEISLRLGDIDRAAHEAAAFGLVENLSSSWEDAKLTWQEQIGGLLAAIRLAEAQQRHGDAELLIAKAEAIIARTSATRPAVALNILKARLAYHKGNMAASQTYLSAAQRLCQGSNTVQLFMEGGEWLRLYLPDLSLWSRTRQSDQSDSAIATVAATDPLTARERQILLFMGEGHPNKIAAYRLGLSEATVKFHLRNIYRKLRVQNRMQALARYRTIADRR